MLSRRARLGASAARAVADLVVLSSLLIAPTAVHAASDQSDTPDPAACRLLADLDLEPLLFAGAGGVLDAVDAHPAPGHATCRWSAMPRDHAADAVPRIATLAHYHFADADRARHQMTLEADRDPRPSLAVTGQDDDAIVRPSPTLVAARHGADIAVFDAGGAELDRPDQVEVRYLLDALALKAAGAAVRPPPWAGSDRVAPPQPAGAAGAADIWTPPPRAAPSGGAWIASPIHGLRTLVDLRFAATLVLTPIALMLFFVGDRRRWTDPHASPPVRRRWPTITALVVVALIVIDATLGSSVVFALIDRFGVAGAATVTGSFATSTQYNRRDVIGYHVLIRAADGRVVDGTFRTDDFNVRGVGDRTVYPGPGDVFTVRYLPSHPEDFTIRNDDQSPWGRKLACGRLAAWRDETARRSSFAPDDPVSRAEAVKAGAAWKDAACAD